MSTLEQVKSPEVLELDNLESLLDLVFPSGAQSRPEDAKRPGTAPPYTVVPESDSTDALRAKLGLTLVQLEDAASKLEAANFRLGYLEALLTSKDDEIKRLSTILRRGSRWTEFISRSLGKR